MRRRTDGFLTTALNVARKPIAGYPAAILAVGATSWVVGDLQAATRIYDASILYLLVILAAAIMYGIGPAIVAAIAGVGLFDWFLDPVGTLIPDGPAELLTLGLFLVVGIVTSQLAAGQRRRADEALEREREATALYTLNSLLVSTNEPSEFISEALRVFESDLEVAGMALLVPDDAGTLFQWTAAGKLTPESAAEQRIAQEVLRDGRPSRQMPRRGIQLLNTAQEAHSDGHPPRVSPERFESIYVAVRAKSRSIGVLRICRENAAADLSAPQLRFLAAIGQQSGIALERARLQAEAAEATALRRAEELKTAVLNSVTHDLRTPLAMIKASAGSLRKGQIEWTDDEKDGFARSIETNADRLDGIVGNLLALSQIDAGMVQPQRQYYPIAAIVDDVVNRLNPLLTDYAVTVEVPDDLPPVPVDYVAMDRVLSNLIENTIHHCPAGTSIVISAIRSGPELIVSVADDGPGISPSVLPRVFERFVRGQSSHSDARRGAGIGLAVVKGLLEAHRGRAWVESREGHGAVFFFALPFEP